MSEKLNQLKEILGEVSDLRQLQAYWNGIRT